MILKIRFRLDLTGHSPHIRRRIWQESIGVWLLTDKSCRMPPGHSIAFSESLDSAWPPYLLDFKGSPGERHVENLKVCPTEPLSKSLIVGTNKILREIGLKPYMRADSLISGPEWKLFCQLRGEITENYVGPDSFWQPSSQGSNIDAKAGFGNAWWVPFPPTLVSALLCETTPGVHKNL